MNPNELTEHELHFLACLLQEHIDGVHDDIPCPNAEKLNEVGLAFTKSLHVKLENLRIKTGK